MDETPQGGSEPMALTLPEEPAPVADGPGEPGNLVGLRRRMRGTRDRLEGQLEAARGRSPLLDRVMTVVLRPDYLIDTLLTGYLALRFFILLFPLAYVAVAGLGLYSAQSGASTDLLSDDLGLGEVVAASVASASEQSQGHLVTLIVGVMAMFWAGRGVLRALRIAHARVWGLAPPRTSYTEIGPLVVGVSALALLAFGAWSNNARHTADAPVVAIIFLHIAVMGGFGLAIARSLPHRGGWSALVPGAVLVGVAAAALNVSMTLYFAPRLARSTATYGALGAGVVLLTYLVAVAWIVVLSAELNAALHEPRAQAPDGAGLVGEG